MRGCANTKMKGFTLIELVVAIVVFAVAFTLLITAFYPSIEGSANPVLQVRAAELGQAYLEEIMAKRFDERNTTGARSRCGEPSAPACSAIGPDGGESRSSYDDVDDYDGLNESPTDALGSPIANYNNYSVQVTVTYAGGDLGLAANDAKKIVVTVNAPLGGSFSFTSYRTNF